MTKNIPLYDPFRDGVSFSLLSKWKECREKAKLHLMGITPRYRSSALTFGTVVHEILDMAYSEIQPKQKKRTVPDTQKVKAYTKRLERIWQKENPAADERLTVDFETALLFSEAVLPIYFKRWSGDLKFQWLGVESEFRVLLSTKLGDVPIVGKRDGVFQYEKSKALWLFETKTKGQINEGALVDRIAFEEQVLMYLLALRFERPKEPIGGILYNIIRRPQLRQAATESVRAFAARCAQDVIDRPEFYFLRLKISINTSDLITFQKEFTATVTDFVLWWQEKVGHYRNTNACEGRYGQCEMLPICSRQDYVPFFKRTKVFSELGG